MSHDINELSNNITHLLTRVDMLKEVTDSTKSKLEKIEQRGSRSELIIQSAHRRLDALTPQVQELHDLKNKSKGVLMVLCVLFGALGSFAHYFLPAKGE